MNEKNFEFFERVYEVVRRVPVGRVTSYGAIGRFLGHNRSARLVGYALNHCHTLGNVPAHRVVNANGLLSGKHHFGTTDEMQKLLEAEGVEVKEDHVQDFKEKFWDPAEHLL